MKFSKLILGAVLASGVATAYAQITDGKSYGEWKGACEDNQCAVVQVALNQEKNPVGRVVLRKLPAADNQPVMIITLPLGVNLHGGIGVAVDGTQIARTEFDFCDQGGCNVAIPLKDGVLSSIKSGKQLEVAAFVADQQQTLPFSLDGATSAINAL